MRDNPADILAFLQISDVQNKQRDGVDMNQDDRLHADMILKLSLDEIKSLCGDNVKKLNNYYINYKKAGYSYSAACLLRQLVIYLNSCNPERAIDYLCREILSNNREQAKNFLAFMTSEVTKPRIVIHVQYWMTGGVERVCETLISYLSGKYDFIILKSESSVNRGAIPIPEGAMAFDINSKSGLSYRLMATSVLVNSSIFVGNVNHDNSFLSVYTLLKNTEIRSVASNHYHFFLPRFTQSLYTLMVKRTERLKDSSVAAWETSYSTNAYACLAPNAALLPNPNSYAFAPVNDTAIASDNNTIICVARFYDSNKRIDKMLKVFRLILNEVPNARLLLVGPYNIDKRVPDINSPTVSELFKLLGFMSENVIFVGETSDVSKHYREAALLLMTTVFEGFALVLNEAAQHGVPSVINEISGLEDIIIDGINGYIVPQDDLQTMADRIINLLKDRQLLNEMRSNALRYSKRFDKAEICSKWDELFSLLLLSANQEEINRKLSQDFMRPPRDANKFIKTLSAEYDSMLHVYYNTYINRKKESIFLSMIRVAFRLVKRIAEFFKIKELLKKNRIYKKLFNDGVMDEMNIHY